MLRHVAFHFIICLLRLLVGRASGLLDTSSTAWPTESSPLLILRRTCTRFLRAGVEGMAAAFVAPFMARLIFGALHHSRRMLAALH